MIEATMTGTAFGRDMLKHFSFTPGYRNLNNGSFGTIPRSVSAAQRQFQDAAEAAPDIFIRYQQPVHIQKSRQAIANLVNAPLETIVFVPNATTGTNTVLRNLVFEPGDKILMFSTIYGACEKTVLSACETTPAQPLIIPLTYPLSDDDVLGTLEAAVAKETEEGGKIRVAIFDTITSMPGLRMPFERLVAACKTHNILSCIDGAHGVGQIPLDLTRLDPDFLVSNVHKWLHTPRGCALFYVPVRNQHLIRTTLPTSHGFIPSKTPAKANALPKVGNFESEWVSMFEYVGTNDLTPFMCVPAAIEFRDRVCGGEDAVMAYCADVVARGAEHVAQVLGTEVIENNEGTLGKGCAMRNVRLPLVMGEVDLGGRSEVEMRDWIQRKIVEEHNGFVPVFKHGDSWWVRLSGQVWVGMDDFEWAGVALKEVCGRVRDGELASKS